MLFMTNSSQGMIVFGDVKMSWKFEEHTTRQLSTDIHILGYRLQPCRCTKFWLRICSCIVSQKRCKSVPKLLQNVNMRSVAWCHCQRSLAWLSRHFSEANVSKQCILYIVKL